MAATAPVFVVTLAGVNAECSVWLMAGVHLVIALIGVPAAME